MRNTGPYSTVRSVKSAGMLPLRTCGLSSSRRSGTAGIGLFSVERRSSGLAMLCSTAAAMERPIVSIRQMRSIRSWVSSSMSNMKRKTSHVLIRQMTTMSLGPGISSVKSALRTRVFTNWPTVPSCAPPDSSSCHVVPASVQKSPS